MAKCKALTGSAVKGLMSVTPRAHSRRYTDRNSPCTADAFDTCLRMRHGTSAVAYATAPPGQLAALKQLGCRFTRLSRGVILQFTISRWMHCNRCGTDFRTITGLTRNSATAEIACVVPRKPYKQLAQFFVRYNFIINRLNINRFSTLFYCQNQKIICNNAVTKDPTTP